MRPGAWAELLIDSREDAASNQTSSGTTNVVLGYLKSYKSMGAAKVECVGGCRCQESWLEGTWERLATLAQVHEFQVQK